MAANSTQHSLHPPSFSQILEAKTKFKYEEFVFQWELEVPSNRDSLNHTFDSPIFVGGKQSQHSWQLRWKAQNKWVDSSYKNTFLSHHTVQLILADVGQGSSFQGKRIKAYARINVKKSDEAEFLKSESAISYCKFEGHDKVSLETYTEDYVNKLACKSISVKDCDLWDEKNGYIVNNTITVCCKILISCISSSGSASKLFSVSSGESYLCFNNETVCRSIVEVTKTALCALRITDIELVTETKSFPAHKVVLAVLNKMHYLRKNFYELLRHQDLPHQRQE